MPNRTAITRRCTYGPRAVSHTCSGNAANVPKVPGAKRMTPMPPMSAIACAGCPYANRSVGAVERLSKMIEAEFAKRDAPPVGIEKPHAAAAAHGPDARQAQADAFRKTQHPVASPRGRSKTQLVVVAACQQRLPARLRLEVSIDGARARNGVYVHVRSKPRALADMPEVREQSVGD